VQTSFENSQITVFRYFGAPIYYVQVVKTYWIKTPLFLIRGLNLSIPNTSNFSIYSATNYITWDQRMRVINVAADPALAYSLLTNSDGNVTSITVMPLKGSWVKPMASIKLTYNDMLNYQFIKATQPNEVSLQNGSISVTTSLIINNTESRSLWSHDFALFSVQNYGNMTSFTFFKNGTRIPSQWNYISDNRLWTSFYVDPHSSVNFTVTALFQEPPH
jgi:hypothetical protein